MLHRLKTADSVKRLINYNYFIDFVKPYAEIPIVECGEPSMAIPLEKFAVELPHPYAKLGAEYGGSSPYCLRQGVVAALLEAQSSLDRLYPQWKLKIFDAYRPIEVQKFMVNYTFNSLLVQNSWQESEISPQQRQMLWEQVYQLWAAPSLDPRTPPPHSTGGAIDLTLIDEFGNTIDMGGEIDELSPRSHPEYYAHSSLPLEQKYNQHRQLLDRVMTEAGFCRHPREWWHFSLGDRMWAWLKNQEIDRDLFVARYGRV
jgi:D-alanyl-D-alanine dipeptidase